ncbi:MAG: hypothetical protein MI807_12665 [Verrucomicrobiales bacterium]|nr:hypothetical protein [Verrucomicrobiales bacterium]
MTEDSLRAVAQVFEVDPNTSLTGWVEAAAHLQMDDLVALLSAVKEGEISETKAITRRSRSPHWGWTAMDPVSQLIVAGDVGPRTQAMAQRLVHQVTQVWAPDCAPLVLTDGFRQYLTALVTHDGQGIQPERRQAKGPWPRPHWMPLPKPLYAQGVTSYRTGVSRACNTGSCSTHATPSTPSWPNEGGRVRRRLGSASTWSVGTLWRQSDDG